MARYTSYAAGTPCWIDLMSPDVDASVAFYTALFGWEAEDQFDDEGNRVYTMLRKDGLDVAGLGGQMPGMEGAPPVWNSYIAVDDVAATAERVQAAGGKVLAPPMQVMGAGEMAVFSDPTQAVFSVWKAGEHAGCGVCNEPDTYSWNELLTRDIDRATAFYSEVFGWDYDAQDMGPMGTYHVIKGGESGGLGGLMAMPPQMPDMVPVHWAVYFSVEDLDAKLARVGELGGQTVQEPMQIPGVGTFATAHDPQGGSFMMLQPESGTS